MMYDDFLEGKEEEESGWGDVRARSVRVIFFFFFLLFFFLVFFK